VEVVVVLATVKDWLEVVAQAARSQVLYHWSVVNHIRL
jgi:hypothetical protein